MMAQNTWLVPGLSGGCALPSFSDLTASKPLFINKGLLLPEQIVSGVFPFFQAAHNIHNRMLVYREILFPDLSPIKASFCLIGFLCLYEIQTAAKLS